MSSLRERSLARSLACIYRCKNLQWQFGLRWKKLVRRLALHCTVCRAVAQRCLFVAASIATRHCEQSPLPSPIFRFFSSPGAHDTPYSLRLEVRPAHRMCVVCMRRRDGWPSTSSFHMKITVAASAIGFYCSYRIEHYLLCEISK